MLPEATEPGRFQKDRALGVPPVMARHHIQVTGACLESPLGILVRVHRIGSQ